MFMKYFALFWQNWIRTGKSSKMCRDRDMNPWIHFSLWRRKSNNSHQIIHIQKKNHRNCLLKKEKKYLIVIQYIQISSTIWILQNYSYQNCELHGLSSWQRGKFLFKIIFSSLTQGHSWCGCDGCVRTCCNIATGALNPSSKRPRR